MIKSATLRFVLTDEALYAANTGRPFDEKGVISVCRQNLSAKGRRGPVRYEGTEGHALIEAIQKRRLSIYKTDQNDLLAEANREDETRRDYIGRSLWELLQNADDAMAPIGTSSADLIGAKGLGFKSVLEVTDAPAIFSGPYAFGFDPKQSKALLSSIMDEPPEMTFGLPHHANADAMVKRMQKSGFSTVIKLPFRDESARATITSRLHGLTPHFLMVSRHLTKIDVRFSDGTKRLLTISGDRAEVRSNAGVELNVEENGTINKESWRVWSTAWPAHGEKDKRLSLALAAIVEDGVPGPVREELPLHVFYPTQEYVGVSFLVHASFDVHGDRNHLRDDPARDGALLEGMAKLASEMILGLPPVSAVQIFKSIVEDAPVGKPKLLSRRIQKTLATAALETAFVPTVGGGKLSPSNVRTWKHGLGEVIPNRGRAVKGLRLASPVIQAVFSELNHYGAESVEPLEAARILRFAHCSTVRECMRAAEAAVRNCLMSYQWRSTLDDLELAPFWPTKNKGVRPLAGPRPLLTRQPRGWPKWLPADELDHDFAVFLKKASAAEKQGWEKLLEGRLLEIKAEWLQYALVPALANWSQEEWDERGWEALLAINEWSSLPEWKAIKPYVEDAETDEVRVALAEVSRLPTRSGWVLAQDAYAGHEIGGHAQMTAFFRAITERPIIRFPKKAADNLGKSAWRSLTRYLGVSWEPKILSWNAGTRIDAPEFAGFYDQNARDNIRYTHRDWYIEFFPEALANVAPAPLFAMLESLLTATKDLTGEYQKIWDGRIYNRRESEGVSRADWQLRNAEYVPCRATHFESRSRRRACELYWPSKGLLGFTPLIDLGATPESRRNNLRRILVSRLGVQEELSKDPKVWCDWANALAISSAEGTKQIDERSVRNFYERLLVQDLKLTPGNVHRIVCEGLGEKGPIVVPFRDAVWINDGRLSMSELRAKLRLAGVPIFPPLLERGKGAVENLGLSRATDVVTVEPIYRESSEVRTKHLTKRLAARQRALGVVCQSKRLAQPNIPDVIAVQGLTLQISYRGQQIGRIPATEFKDGDRWLIDWDGRWKGLANALADQYAAAADLRHRFRTLIGADASEVSEILTGDGIPEYSLQELKLELAVELDEDSRVDPSAEEASSEDSLDLAEDDLADDEADFPHDDNLRSDDNKEEQSSVTKKQVLGKNGGLSPRDLYGTGDGTRAKRGSTKRAAVHAEARKRGLAAEAWLQEKLQLRFPSAAIRANDRDELNRETDIVLLIDNTEWHIEVKSLVTERIYWSKLEQEKAELHSGRYLMALMIPSETGHFIWWSWDPLTDLLDCERRVEWVWAATEDGPPHQPGSWRLLHGLSRPERKPDGLNHVIRIQRDFLDDLTADDGSLNSLATRIQ